jgi:hypothetical protein
VLATLLFYAQQFLANIPLTGVSAYIDAENGSLYSEYL